MSPENINHSRVVFIAFTPLHLLSLSRYTMLYNTIFTATLLAVAMAQGPRTCYQGVPESAGPATDCISFINTFCNDASISQTPVRIGDSTSRCFNLPGGDRCDFIAFNTFTSGVSPSNVNCKSVLNDIATRCPLGGFGQVSDTAYTFTVDRNHGLCGSSVQGGS
ncbi:hypothetical protein D9756_005778 [Leucocoprinus leucothites]|uniref:Glycan binding protein Y3-like domain-containing protein n=1 Tax=Leucocoprinus leucothites TaxID=201217 RepID=A0A8H5D7I4_9AGAR|nr:hypothetical protein D9756_005778 [Leucoagaricus leucothites]